MDDIMAQFGFGVDQPDSEDKMRGLAKTLRGNRDLGQFFQFSGNKDVRNAGQNMLDTSQQTIDTIGDRRSQGLTRTMQQKRDAQAVKMDEYKINRNVDQDKLKAEALEYERAGWTDLDTYEDKNGNISLRGRKDGRGPLMEVPDSEGYTPYDQYKSRYNAKRLAGAPKRLKIEGTNLEYLRYPDGKIVYGMDEYPSMQAFAKARPDVMSEGNAAQANEKYAIEFAGEIAEGKAKEVTDLRTNVSKTNSSYINSEGNMHAILNALEQGANSGQIYKWFPTITNATSLLESIVSSEALTLLNTYQLKPVSDADMKILRQVATPDMDSAALKKWAENKVAVLQRAQASGRVFEEWVSTHDEVPRGPERDELQKQMDAASNAAVADPGQVNLGDGPLLSKTNPGGLPQGVTEEDIVATMAANSMTRQQVLDKLGSQ